MYIYVTQQGESMAVEQIELAIWNGFEEGN